MSDRDEVQQQLDMISGLATSAPAKWKRIFVNHEIVDSPTEFNTSSVSFVVVKPLFSPAKKVDYFLQDDDRKRINEVGRALMRRANVSVITLDIIIRDNRKFRIYPGYGEAERLGGDVAATARHLRYINEDPMLADESGD